MKISNPVIFGEHADPSILLDGDTYYVVFSSCFGNTSQMQMWKSSNLMHWIPMYYVLQETQLRGVWAPELVKVEDTYYIYSYAPDAGCFVTTTKNIEKGDWSDPVYLSGTTGIDPGHIIDEKGNRYLCMSSNMLYPLSKDGKTIVGEGKKICEEWKIPDEIDVEGSCPEGPKFFKRGEYYYLIIAQGGTVGPPTSHGVISYRSKSVTGPYEMSPYRPVVSTKSRSEKWWSKGHGTVFQAKDSVWYMILHAIENGHRYAGRIPVLVPVEWDEQGWFYVKDDASSYNEDLEKEKKETLSSYLQYNKGMTEFTPMYNYCNHKILSSTIFSENGIKISAIQKHMGMEGMITFSPLSHCFSYSVTVTVQKGAAFSLGYWFSDSLNCGIYAESDCLGIFKHSEITFPKTKQELHSNKSELKMQSIHGTVSYWYREQGEQTWKKIINTFDVADWNPNVSTGFDYARANMQVWGTGNVIIENMVYQDLDDRM